jgi:hemolysin activation/secretion protein
MPLPQRRKPPLSQESTVMHVNYCKGVSPICLGLLAVLEFPGLPAWGAELSKLQAIAPPLPQTIAQPPSLPTPDPIPSQVLPRDTLPPGTSPLPQQPQAPPSPDQLLPTVPLPPSQAEPFPGDVTASVRVERFEVVGRTGQTRFEPDLLAEVAKRAVVPPAADASPPDGTDVRVDRTLTFAQLLQARDAVTQYYFDRGYITSGAILPPQQLRNGIVRLEVVEGRVAEINVQGTRRLRSQYVRDRLALVTTAPLNRDRLLEGLQLLQLDPLIGRIEADLQVGDRPGTNVLAVTVQEADSLSGSLNSNNGRSPSIGSVRRQAEVTQANLLGLGDGLSLAYTNTDGSNGVDVSYSIPVNPRNGSVRLAVGASRSDVIEEPFAELGIRTNSRYYELSFRQPIVQTPTTELALGLTASRQESQTELLLDDIGPFALSPGADSDGRTRVSALRFFQEWTRRTGEQVFAVRSQFSLGLDLFDSTINRENGIPDSRFFAWRGQAQWVRRLATDTLFLVRTDAQLTGDDLLTVEQFGLGGQASVRGYRQDQLLTDNGVLLSTELRLPILRVPRWRGVLQLVPFLDFGTTWNTSAPDPNTRTLAGTGVGLLWQMGDRFTARIDWGIPLVSVENRGRTWQENGIYFSIGFLPF